MQKCKIIISFSILQESTYMALAKWLRWSFTQSNNKVDDSFVLLEDLCVMDVSTRLEAQGSNFYKDRTMKQHGWRPFFQIFPLIYLYL
jgi:hypothetical protein